jgi:Rieske Fe-S protein
MTDGAERALAGEHQELAATRRAVLRGVGAIGVAAVGVGAVAACSTSLTAGDQGGNPAHPAAKTIKASEVPVGGGTIYPDTVIVVTQPVAGQFKAFSAMCMHLGCVVTKVDQGKIICPCHGSEYNIADGSVYQGPATRALDPRTLMVSGDTITVS